MKSEVKIYCIFHNKLSKHLTKYDKEKITFIGVNQDIEKIIPEKLNKYNIIYEYKLNKYDKLFQDCGYNESSAIVHIGINNLHKNYEFIAFCQYDNFINEPINYQNNTCYYIRLGFNHINNHYFPLELFFNKYNSFFKTNHNIESLKNLCKIKTGGNVGIPLLSTFIIHTSVYDNLYEFWISFMYDIFCICKIEDNDIPKHHGHVGGIMERVFGITLILNENLKLFKKIHNKNLDTKRFNYNHINNGKGNRFETPNHIIKKYVSHKSGGASPPVRRLSKYYGFSPKLSMWYAESYSEISVPIESMIYSYAIFPKRVYKSVDLKMERKYYFIFIGALLNDTKTYNNRKWILSFIKKQFNSNSYLQFTDQITRRNYQPSGSYDHTLQQKGFVPKEVPINERNYFDQTYFRKLSQSKFCLCPGGDANWSMRFYESLMCKCIPIVDTIEETYRSKEESHLDYKYYLSSDKEFVYRNDWVEHNYELFLRYHTLEHYHH